MLILIIGGAFQGKSEFAKRFNLPILDNLQDKVKAIFQNRVDVKEEIIKQVEGKNIVVICNEVGCGIIPLDKTERVYREITGRVLIDIAKIADQVYKIEAGIAQKIKG